MNERVMVLDGGRRVLLPRECQSPSGNVSFERVKLILGCDRYSVLVTGETGCGKEIFADCAFQMTKLAKGRCQKINCAGLNREFVGSELFGHLKGAYTGADENREGVLKACDGGILFLDEIGWLPPDLQARLLRFMETGEIRPLGADKVTSHAKVRIIAATNQDANTKILHDLRHRFDFELHLPTLHDRGADILWFLGERGFLGAENGYTGVTLRTLIGMMCKSWPGNVRELKKYCQRKVLFLQGADASNDKPHVLDDWCLGDCDFLDEWSAFAGMALGAVEKHTLGIELQPADASAMRLLALLVGFHAGMNWLSWKKDSVFVAIVPIGVLRAALAGELKGLGSFDFELLQQALEVLAPGFFDEGESLLEFKPDCDAVGLGEALEMLWNFMQLFENPEPLWEEYVSHVTGGLQSFPGKPTAAFIKQIGYGGPDGLLFAVPEAPRGVVSIETVLERLGLSVQDREICVRYHGGASCANIAKELKIGLATVKEHLAELRRKHNELAPFLTKKPAGRKAKK